MSLSPLVCDCSSFTEDDTIESPDYRDYFKLFAGISDGRGSLRSFSNYRNSSVYRNELMKIQKYIEKDSCEDEYIQHKDDAIHLMLDILFELRKSDITEAEIEDFSLSYWILAGKLEFLHYYRTGFMHPITKNDIFDRIFLD